MDDDINSPFYVLENRGGWSKLRCKECSCVFEVNVHTEKNLEFDEEDCFYKSVCPNCQVREP